MTVRADPRGVDAATYRAALYVFSNDPLDPFAEVPVTVEVRPHNVSATGCCTEHRCGATVARAARAASADPETPDMQGLCAAHDPDTTLYRDLSLRRPLRV